MSVVIGNNHVMNEKRGPLTGRERAMRRLLDPRDGAIQIPSGGHVAVSISNFVIDLQAPDLPDNMYHCSVCGAHVIIYGVKVAGEVRCGCGPLEGTPL
jgi:hypothetical protein